MKTPLKIALIGSGNMGKPLNEAIESRGHTLKSITSLKNPILKLDEVDVVIDFSTPEALFHYAPQIAKSKVPLVTGTTGWNDRQGELRKIIEEGKSGAIWSGNFSVGVNLFWSILDQTVQQMRRFESNYDSSIHEIHHRYKVDSPSGTALKMAEIILDGSPAKKTMVTEALHRAPKADELHVSSTRGGHHPGQHSVIWDSPFDSIELKHTARNRNGFALGAVIAAEFIVEKQLFGLIPFTDIFSELKF